MKVPAKGKAVEIVRWIMLPFTFIALIVVIIISMCSKNTLDKAGDW